MAEAHKPEMGENRDHMTVSEAGQKGGHRVHDLVEEGKEKEAQERGENFNERSGHVHDQDQSNGR